MAGGTRDGVGWALKFRAKWIACAKGARRAAGPGTDGEERISVPEGALAQEA